MKRNFRFLLFLVVLFETSSVSYGQLVGTAGTIGAHVFLPGRYLEVGIAGNGSWGAGPSPTGYHPNSGAGTNNIASVYDYGHDGWTVGAPAYFGDYTYPGTPFEGWSMQANGVRNDAFYTTDAGWTGVGFTGALTGANSSYADVAGVLTGVWNGTTTGLSIRQTTTIDTNGSAAIVTTVFKNTSAAAIPGVYYWRTADPDDDETYSFIFNTNNTIVYQNDADHRVMVSSTGTEYTNAYMALGTKDCRAKSMIYVNWSTTPPAGAGNTLDKIYAGTATGLGATYYTLGQETLDQDIAIGLIYDLGTIAAGDSTFISYAYIYDGNIGIDSAFLEPDLTVGATTFPPTGVPPAVNSYTVNACGQTTLPVNILNAAIGDWTWSTWTWAPATGLASASGSTNTITVSALPATITYTITGTDSFTCAARTIYLTITTCNSAIVNSPCLGDSLIFNAPGDSTGATYVWLGPDSYTTTAAITQSFNIYPSVWADTGTYYVIKTVGGVSDTAHTIVTIHPLPTVTVGSNSPLCTGAVDTLLLTATPGAVPIATYSWTGPAGFTSALQDPTIPGFVAADAGTYTVIVATSFGCMGTGTTNVIILPPPGPPVVTGIPAYCFGATFVPFTITPAFGATVYWYPTSGGGTGSTTAPTVNTSVPGSYTFYYGQTIGSCESPIESITVVVYPPIVPNYTYSIHRGCTEDTVYFSNTSTGFTSDMWNFGDGSPTSTSTGYFYHIYLTQSSPKWAVKLTDYFATCSESITDSIDTRHSVTAAFTPQLDTICFGGMSTMNNQSTVSLQDTTGHGQIDSFMWNFGDGTPGVTSLNSNPLAHSFAQAGIYTVSLEAIDSIGCTSIATHSVYVIGYTINSWHDTTLCIKEPLPLTNVIVQDPELGLTNYTYSWSPSTDLDSDNIQVPSFFALHDTITYVLTVNLPGAWDNCKVYDTMTIRAVLGKKLADVTLSGTIMYGNTYQLNADSLVYYWWVPDNGSLSNPNINNPIATPDTTTTYTVYGMDQYGCVDSDNVTVTVDSNMTEFIPTAFTPNNDGLNDYFHPVGLKFQNIVDFRVYNRWGQQVFYTNSASSPGWDGKFNGVPQDMDVYYYTIIVYRPDNGQNVLYKGDVTLIR